MRRCSRRWLGMWGMWLSLVGGSAQADSPLTTVTPHTAYLDLPAVTMALRAGPTDKVVWEFLLGGASTAEKAAVVSALGTRPEPGRARLFLDALAARRQIAPVDLELRHLNAADRFVFGYLLALESPGELKPLYPGASGLLGAGPVELMSMASAALPGDFTVAFVRALTRGQADLTAGAWCTVWLEADVVLDRFPEPRRNLRPAAVNQATSYLALYQRECALGMDPSVLMSPEQGPPAAAGGAGSATTTAPPVVSPPSTATVASAPPRVPIKGPPSTDQIYDVVGYGPWIATGTQGGVVLWDPQAGEVVQIREEELCVHLLARADGLWAGCQHRLLRWNGTAWKTYLYDPTSSDAYKVLDGPHGELVVAHDELLRVYNPAKDAFDVGAPSLGPAEGYDLAWGPAGEPWRIEFLSAVVGGERRFPVKSSAYPGADPRGLYLDPVGGVWVADFANGFYRLGPEDRVFQWLPIVREKGSDLAIDGERQRLWLLHYTDGLYLKEGETPAIFFDLSSMEYLRALWVGESGDVWVGGWNQLLHVWDEGGAWRTQAYRASGG